MLYSGGGWANETHMIWPQCNKMHEGQDNLARQELKGLWTRAVLAIFCSVSKLPLGLRIFAFEDWICQCCSSDGSGSAYAGAS